MHKVAGLRIDGIDDGGVCVAAKSIFKRAGGVGVVPRNRGETGKRRAGVFGKLATLQVHGIDVHDNGLIEIRRSDVQEGPPVLSTQRFSG